MPHNPETAASLAASPEPNLTEIALIEKAALRVGMKSLLNHGAASCVYTEGCAGVSQEQLVAYTREVALHCAVALAAAPAPVEQPASEGYNTIAGNAREPVDAVLEIVESYGPWGRDINEGMRFQIVLADEVKRLRKVYASAVQGRADFRIALREARASISALPPEAKHLTGDALQAHQQCRAVVHLAREFAEIYSASASILASGMGPVEIIGEASAEDMEWLGDAINNMDGVTEEDLWLDPIFEAAQARWPVRAAKEQAHG